MKNIYGLIGEKLGHSFSPQIHSLIFQHLGIKSYYHLFEVKKEELRTAIEGLKVLGTKGVNVTIPYKVDVIGCIDKLANEAAEIGAINTIVFNDNYTKGYNTDYFGFIMLLDKNNVSILDKTVVVLGTGGASRAAVKALKDKGASEIILVSRNPEKAKRKYNSLKIISYDEISKLENKDIIINCTPVGMYPDTDKSPIGKKEIEGCRVVLDLIYNPRETLLIKQARELNIKADNGLYMLVGQAIKAQELWQGTKIDSTITNVIFKEIEIFFNWR
ncbi:shikimate dehydrogenase [Sporosalibacterium faouarense]|uniref:shikimate dehydrogenase n=1 Tax=Sporosalibacterium faouarense TaxID=516123 RepID=UPI00192C53EE|nr:shikimate dehydrogenase [Sporosalibacterium faouarense]